jgi:hypothetical protein
MRRVWARVLHSEEMLTLFDWKRTIFALYEEIRNTRDPGQAWDEWRSTRERLFRTHPSLRSPRSGVTRSPAVATTTTTGGTLQAGSRAAGSNGSEAETHPPPDALRIAV